MAELRAAQPWRAARRRVPYHRSGSNFRRCSRTQHSWTGCRRKLAKPRKMLARLVKMLRRQLLPRLPPEFRWGFLLGGRQNRQRPCHHRSQPRTSSRGHRRWTLPFLWPCERLRRQPRCSPCTPLVATRRIQKFVHHFLSSGTTSARRASNSTRWCIVPMRHRVTRPFAHCHPFDSSRAPRSAWRRSERPKRRSKRLR